jgi:D-alanyl-D-alanine-carboxypeptidase/D-alanyl-D-alanine-endopeptidase
LAARAGREFRALVRERVLAPLGMARTGYALSPAMRSDLAVGHDSALRPAVWGTAIPVYDLMPAAGMGLCSSAGDVLKLASAALGYRPSPLAAAIALTVHTHRAIPGSHNAQALGWTLLGEGRDQLVFRDGGTFGFASCLVWDRARRVGAVILVNCVADVGDIGRHILRPDFPLATPSRSRRTEIAVEAVVLARHAGRYRDDDGDLFTIALEGSFLTFEAPADWGLPKLRIRPESRNDFFAAELPLRVTFEVGADGATTGMTLFPPRGGKGVPARKVG